MIKAILTRTMKSTHNSLLLKTLTSYFSSSSNNNNNNNNNNPRSGSTPSDDPTSFAKPGMVNRGGVFIDEERIKAKMKEIKARGDGKQEEKRAQDKKQFLKNYQINKDESKVRKFRKDTGTERLMQIQDVSLDLKPTILQVTSLAADEIEVDSFPYPPAVILTPNQILNWQIQSISNMRPKDLKILQLITPTPSYVILGCPNPKQIHSQVKKYLESLNVIVDYCGVFQAVSNFNTYANDQLNVMAFIVMGREEP